MDQNNVISFRHHQSSSSDRFFGVFSPPQSDVALDDRVDEPVANDDEIKKDDMFWTGKDITESQLYFTSPSQNSCHQSCRQHEKAWIISPGSLAVLLGLWGLFEGNQVFPLYFSLPFRDFHRYR
ncbi:hypothetical protein RND71_001930 [Anisodus tanguticus]|uniref:Uncharacterized protein n=1 Tax=Anisodus tanguticus TaxID=243964 RepID=A0AAE1SYW6_9SOLA|nr:hypothetical protein RND71_001930 [Anisodus tanguticus]